MLRRPVLSFFAVVLGLSCLPRTVLAVEVDKFRFKESSVLAVFEDNSGCIASSVFVAASSSATNNGSVVPLLAAVVVTRYDTCQGVQLMAASGDVQEVDLHVDSNLQTATLHAVIPCYDFETDRFFDMLVDLSWRSTGGQTVDATTNVIENPPFTIRTQFQGRLRPAQATGTVREGAMNFTPLPSTEALIQSLKLGEVTITRAE